ncbi:MAG: HAD family hydrolase [Dehalococcoidia bacterium]
MAIRGVLFDWGGTIVRDDSLIVGAPAAAVASFARTRLEIEVADADLERAFHAVLPEYRPGETETAPHISRLLGAAFTWLGLAVGAGDVEACARIFFREATHALAVYDDARALLASLKVRGYRTAVVTNAVFPAALFEPKVNELGLAGYIDSFVASADVGLAKPNPSPFLKALDALHLEPHEAIFVGDVAETDIAGARAAGMRAVLLERTDRARDRAGFLVIERLTALNELLGEGPAG